MVFRSEEMTLCQLYLQAEAAYACVSELGELAIVQFRDLNPDVNAFNRNFVSQVRRCEEMERQLRYFERELKEANMQAADEIGSNPEAPAPGDMVDLEATYERLESEMKELTNNIQALRHNQHELVELKHVLMQTESFFQESDLDLISDATAFPSNPQASADMELNHVQDQQETDRHVPMHLGYVAGVLNTEKLQSFLRLLWFACRGNVYVRYNEIDELIFDAHSGTEARKTVFMVFFQGDQLKSRVQKICEGYRAQVYPCPESSSERKEMVVGILQRMSDLEVVLTKSAEQKLRVLNTVARNLHTWYVKVLKIKAIYHTMNMFHTEGKNYVAECWTPVADMGTVQLVLNKATETVGGSTMPPSLLHPMASDKLPTYFRTNKFTKAFQTIIDSYGVATYKEVNPMPFSIITFPFLFSVMFGDMGHGILMALFGFWLVIREKQLIKKAEDSEIFGIFYGGRYLILMMGCFSIYSGIIYNDIFSKSFNIYGTVWKVPYDNATLQANDHMMLDPNDTNVYGGHPYPVGLDPVWALAENKITFTNSYKEKISVIFAVCQMLTGVVLSIFNHSYFHRPINIICEFIPQVIFLLALFGYLDALILTKWITVPSSNSACAPDLLIGFINMFLLNTPDPSEEVPDPDPECHIRTWFTGQYELQIVLLILALVSALWMLLAKPCFLHRQHKRRLKQQAMVESQRLISEPNLDIDPEGHLGQESSTDVGTPALLHCESDTGPPAHQFESDTDAILPDMSDADTDTEAAADKLKKKKIENVQTVDTVKSAEVESPDQQEQTEVGELYIIQAIHTIEFCLGCISHTASYLRLWALSLAHAQLSEVLWNMVLRIGFQINGYLGAVVLAGVFSVWVFFTVSIMLFMEGLSAFLHTLRLHWVEFQSKFYKGEGFSFLPFNFNEIVRMKEA